MNTNPTSIRVLCYGDSNTWGDPPNKLSRYPADVRWPGRLQKLLGNEFEIIEEGLCGRTTDIDDSKEAGRNGKTYLLPCLNTHKPIDIFILMLGTNDLKERFKKSPEDIAKSINDLIQMVKTAKVGQKGKAPKILLVSPPVVKERALLPIIGMKEAAEKSRELGAKLKDVARKNDSLFVDISKYVGPSRIDGAHLSAESHRKIAEILSRIVSIKNV